MDINEYIQREVCKDLVWIDDHYEPKATANDFPFLAGKTFTEEEFNDLLEGRLLAAEIKAHGDMLIGNLLKNGMEYFADHKIPMMEYYGQVAFGFVCCTIWYKHRTTGAILCLNEVYFDQANGEILQAVMSFR